MKFFLSILTAFLFFSLTTPAFAIVSPADTPNNKYGIHIVDENDLDSAAKLVNSQGGDWGYVTMVIRDDDRNSEKWQRIFDSMRSLHLIPIIRLATHPKGDTWEAPKVDDARAWADFLDSLYWVNKNRYVIIFNEPNHAKEWGGSINPREYAQILTAFSWQLKKTSKDFFILPAGLDASAPNGGSTMDELDFLREMIFSDPQIFSYIDGWTSHSYPNPMFSGKTTDIGRGTLRTYLWEMEILKSFGQKDNLPVFITETGWAHEEGVTTNKSYYPASAIADFIKEASQDIWSDEKVVAVTPFILNYQSYPFANFSWQKPNENSFYPFFDTYKSLAKVSGKPQLNTIFDGFNPLVLKNLDASDQKTSLQPEFNKKFIVSLFYRLFNL